MGGFQVTSQQRGAGVVVAASGDIDVVTSPAFDSCLSEAARPGRRVIVDLAGVDFMDTSALMVIVAHWKKLTAVNGSLVLAGARQACVRVLWITGLADMLPMFDSVEQALAARHTP
jgi:anti-sigma B factor antagonist